METQDTSNGKARKMKTGLIILGVVLLIALLALIAFIIRANRADDQATLLLTEKAALAEQQQQLQGETAAKDSTIATLQVNMQETMEAQAEEIRARDARISRLGRQAAEVEELQQRVDYLETYETDYKRLKVQYAQLLSEWEDLDMKNGRLMARHEALKDSVEQSRDLKASNIYALTKWERWLWADRYNVDRARRIDETLISFEINRNPFAPEGPRRVYLNLIGPSDQVMYPSAETFVVEDSGEETPYTSMQEVSYEGEPLQLRFAIGHPEGLEPGAYRIRVYIDGKPSGTGGFQLE